ncbi:MAG: alpha/beta hydrolase [Burkholderiales bacterium]|nr:alpha/beta hydrolase [Burkholderiales bacterium]
MRSTHSSWAARTCRAEARVETLKVVLLTIAAGYIAIAGVVWLAQDSLVFYPPSASPIPAAPAGWRIEEVAIQARDGTRLAGVLAMPDATKPPLVIYFGGNAEEVTGYAPMAGELYGARAVLFVNYRGYGASGGKPGEAALVADGAEIFDWAARRADLDTTRIALHGRSLGTGVAVQVAAARPARCVVLTSPFASALDVAREIYPWLPVAALLRHPFDSGAHAPRLRIPALVLMGSADTLIRPRHSEKLAGLWGGTVERVALEGFGHNDLDLHPGYARAIRSFLDRCVG